MIEFEKRPDPIEIKRLSGAQKAYGTLWRCDLEPSVASRIALHFLLESLSSREHRAAMAWATRRYGPPTKVEASAMVREAMRK